MLDLKKYSDSAEADPGFRARLLKNANQAIKDEFGEDLPYKLKCKEKLVFEIEVMDEMSDADAKSVAGGSMYFGPPPSKNAFVDDVRPRSTCAYRGRYGFFGFPPHAKPDSPGNSSRNNSPFVRSRDDSGIQTWNHDVKQRYM